MKLKVDWPVHLQLTVPFVEKAHRVSTHRYGSKGPNAFDINSRAALATLNAGLSHTHLSTITAILNIPPMNHVTYKAREREVGKTIEKVAAKSCLKAIVQYQGSHSLKLLKFHDFP